MKSHPLIASIKTAYEISKTQHIPEVKIYLQTDVRHAATRTYNKPTVKEIAAIIPTGQPNATARDIVIRYKDDRLLTIHQNNPAYETLHYVLLYPYGTLSYPLAVQRTRS